MYETFYGLHAEPFSVAPDPRFMYLSDPHREALKHLEIGLRGAGGFVLLTGEIGAGKTTVWRSFLEQLPPTFDIATVVNPRLGVDTLLARLCADLGVEPDDDPARDPIDALHGHLLLAHAQGRRTLIAIDEAQALSDAVLEQLRLLTNLVTSDRKLLQVLLIGQPELLDMLERPALEPLAQRVVARYHLPALPEAETRRYVAHRLAVAGAGGTLPFEDAALARIHAHCLGVPRRINVLCDRLLLAGWQARAPRLDAAFVDRVAREVFERPERPGRDAAGTQAPVAAGPEAAAAAAPVPAPPTAPATPAAADTRAIWVMAALALVLGVVASPWLRSVLAGPSPANAVAAGAPPARGAAADVQALASPPGALPGTPGGVALDTFGGDTAATTPATPAGPPVGASPTAAASPPLAAGNRAAGVADGDALPAPTTLDTLVADAADAGAAWRALAGLYGLRPPTGPPCIDVRAQGLLCFEGRGGLAQIRQLDRPALLRLVDDRGRAATVLLVGLAEGTALLRLGERALRVPLSELARGWRGDFVALWRPPPGYRPGRIVADDDDTLARWVQARLGAIDGLAGRPLDQQVLAFQLAQGLTPDGLAGAQTLMALNRVSGVDAPRLLSP